MTYIYLSNNPWMDKIRYDNGQLKLQTEIKDGDFLWFLHEEKEKSNSREIVAKSMRTKGDKTWLILMEKRKLKLWKEK